jgi:hypothetical protein
LWRYDTYHIFWTIGRYFFSLILQMWPIYCFMTFRYLKVTCNWIPMWKMMQITFKVHFKSISANIAWNRCGLQYKCGLYIIFFKK